MRFVLFPALYIAVGFAAAQSAPEIGWLAATVSVLVVMATVGVLFGVLGGKLSG